MKNSLIIIIIVTLLLIAVGLIATNTLRNKPSENNSKVASPSTQSSLNITEENQQIVSPSSIANPQQKTIRGQVTGISGPIGYKNSLVIQYVTEGGQGSIYVTEKTPVYNEQGQTINRSYIKKGQYFTSTIIPSEGGSEALDFRVTTFQGLPENTSAPTPST